MSLEFGLIGKKLGHSFSKAYFTEKFHTEHIDAFYENFEIEDIGAFRSLLDSHPRLRGLNVTIPYKEAIIPHLDALSKNAEAVGAVNTILIVRGLVTGYNTDVVGFRESLAEVYDEAPGGKALILGTGGASKAVEHVLRHYFDFETIDVVSREPKAAHHLTYPQLAAKGLADYHLIVNCTPVGMYPNIEELPALPLETLQQSCLVFDLIYNPEETKLLEAARIHGCPTVNGWDMLIRQAEASWEIWMEGV